MTQLKAKHGLDGVLADAGDLVPLLALDQSFFTIQVPPQAKMRS